MLLNASGDKVPPVDALKTLAAINPRLSLRWMGGAVAYWGIMERWRPDDPRREGIRKGEVAESADFDMIAALPPDCSPYEIEGYIARRFVRVTDPSQQAEDAVNATKRTNDATAQAHKERFLNEQDEKTKRTTKHDLELQMGEATANAQIVVPANIGGKGKRK